MRLPKPAEILPTDFEITKDGKFIHKGKELSKAYEKKYASYPLHNFREVTDKNNRVSLRTKDGKFASKEQKEKFNQLKEVSTKRLSKNIDVEKTAPYGRKLKGSFMKGNYAITTLCTCQVVEKGYENETSGKIVKHYYTISTNERLTYGDLVNNHNHDYPLHDLLDIQVTSTKEVSFE